MGEFSKIKGKSLNQRVGNEAADAFVAEARDEAERLHEAAMAGLRAEAERVERES